MIIVLSSKVAFAAQYIADNRITYIGETDLYYCYIYDFDVNLVIRFSDFHQSGNWAVTIAAKPKFDRNRNYFIDALQKDVDSASFDTMVLPNSDNKFYFFAQRFIFDKEQNKLFLKDSFWLNYGGELIAMGRTDYIESKITKNPGTWQIKDLADKHIHKRYKDEYERRNTVVR